MLRILERIWENFKEYIILVLLLIISLIIFSLNKEPAVKSFKTLAFAGFASVTSVISDIIDVAKYKSENDRLRKVNTELMMQVNRLREFGIQNSELKRLLGIKDTTTLPLVPAAIVSKTLTKSQSTFTINAGNKLGIEPGMPVINDQGLIGIVHTASDDFAIVRTLKNRDLALTVKNQRSRFDGVMKWNGEDLVIVNVPKTYDVEIGDRVITSELSSIVAVPLPVGVVASVDKVGTGIFNELRIKPFVDFVRVENVFVIKIVQSKKKKNIELNFYSR